MSENQPSDRLFRTVLFATDFSESARQAFPLACSLSRGESTRLIVLHVEEPVPFGELDVPVYVPGEDTTPREFLQDQLREVYFPGCAAEVEYLVEPGKGNAAEQILRTAEQRGCDLIVMGTRGRSGVGRLLLGSVAEAALRGARCACLTVKSRPLGSAGAETTANPIRTILVPTDYSQSSETALRVARALARDHGARLVVVHVCVPEPLPAAVSEAFTDLAIGRDSLEQIRRRLEGPDLKQPVETQLRRGDPVAAILEAAEGGSCDLIVMGTHGRTGLGRLLMGSVAEGVLRQAPCAVLTIKTPSAVHGNAAAVPVALTR